MHSIKWTSTLRLVVSSLLLLLLGVTGWGKSWRQISPLKTTRAEILQSLGPPFIDPSDKSEYFDLGNEIVTLRWTRGNCFEPVTEMNDRPLYPSDLVIQVTVKPKVPLSSEEFAPLETEADAQTKDKTSKFRNLSLDCSGTEESISCSLSDLETGFGYSTEKAGIAAIYYFATESEWSDWKVGHVACTGAGANP